MTQDEDTVEALVHGVFSGGGTPEKCAQFLREAAQQPAEGRLRLADSLEQWLRMSLLVTSLWPEPGQDSAENNADIFMRVASFVFTNKGKKSIQPVQLLMLAQKDLPEGDAALPERQIDIVAGVAKRMNVLCAKSADFLEQICALQTKSEMFEHLAAAELRPQEEQIYIAEALEGVMLNIRQKIDVEGEACLDSLGTDQTLGYGPANAAQFAQFIVKAKNGNTSDFVAIYAEKSRKLPAAAKFPEYSATLYAAYQEANALQKQHAAQIETAQKKHQAALIKKACDSHISKLRQLRPARPSLKPPSPGRQQ